MCLLGFLIKCGLKNYFKKMEGNLYGFKLYCGVNLNFFSGDFYYVEKYKLWDFLVISVDL